MSNFAKLLTFLAHIWLFEQNYVWKSSYFERKKFRGVVEKLLLRKCSKTRVLYMQFYAESKHGVEKSQECNRKSLNLIAKIVVAHKKHAIVTVFALPKSPKKTAKTLHSCIIFIKWTYPYAKSTEESFPPGHEFQFSKLLTLHDHIWAL